MKITEVRIFSTESKDGKLKAFATMTFDDWFVVRNVKVIQGNNGLFVAMPSRKAMNSCLKCRSKNVVGSRYCNQCGSELDQQHTTDARAQDAQGSHMDIAHPITQECRVYIQDQILEAYDTQTKHERAKNNLDSKKSSVVSSDTQASIQASGKEDDKSSQDQNSLAEAATRPEEKPPKQSGSDEGEKETSNPETTGTIDIEDGKDIEL